MPRGRPPSAKTLVDRQLGRNVKHPVLPAGDDFIVPNYSGVDNYIKDVAGDIWLRITGGTMTGDLNMGSRNISNVRDLALDTISTDVNFGTTKPTGTGAWNIGDGSQMATSAAPTTDAMFANKKYVDDQGGGGINIQTAMRFAFLAT